MTVAILPVKGLELAKQRLATNIDQTARARLMTAMLQDVVARLHQANAIDQVVVVTRDAHIASLANELQVELLQEPPECGSHSAAARLGAEWADGRGARRVICCAADCPLIDAAEIDQLLARCDSDKIDFTVVPDRAGTGTNALVIIPPTRVVPSFGPGSCDRHLQIATDAGVNAQVIKVPSLELDLDTAADYATLQTALASNPSMAPRTAAAIRAVEASA